jgi:hypothetical protein
MTIFYCLSFQSSPKLEGKVPVFIFPQEQGSPVIPPGTGLVDMSCSVWSMMYKMKAGDEFFPELLVQG